MTHSPRFGTVSSLENGLVVGLAAALVFAHAAPLAAMVRQWSDSPMYSYGFTVPIVSAFLLWSRRSALAALSPKPARGWAAVVLIAGVGLLAAGRAGSIQVLEQVAFLVSLCGLVLLVFGVSYVRVAWASLAYLLLMVPLWDAFTEPLHWPFQQRSAAIGVAVMQAIGIPAYREGTVIELPGLTLEVARACSGVNYLIAVLALGLPLAYLYVRGFWRAALLLVGAVTIAALSNGLRVALIGVLAHYEVGSPLHGPFHVLHGLFVSGIGYVALFGGVRLLESRDRTTESAPPPVMRRRFAFPRVEAAACVLLFAGLGSGVLAHAPERVPLAEGFERFPISLGGWEAERQPAAAAWPPREMWSGADREIRRRYSSRGTSVDVYVAYYERQLQDKEIAGSRTAELHRNAKAISVRGPGGASFSANLVKASADQPETIFWYELDVVEATSPRAKLRTLWNALLHARSNGAVVAVSNPRLNGASAGPDDLTALAWSVHDALGRHLPR